MNLEFTIRGTSPLMMHNVRLANPLDKYAKRMAAANTAKKVKGADKEEALGEMARIEWEGGLYHTETDGEADGIGAYLPAGNLYKAIIEAARLTKEGKSVEQGLSMVGTRFAVEYEGPRDIRGMWEADRFCDIRMVVVGRSKVPRARPIFHSWRARFAVWVDPEMCTPDRVPAFVRSAGLYKGVGEARTGAMGMGRFEVIED